MEKRMISGNATTHRYMVGIFIGTSKTNTISLGSGSFGTWMQTRAVATVGAGLARPRLVELAEPARYKVENTP
jgi:hypothetical protein